MRLTPLFDSALNDLMERIRGMLVIVQDTRRGVGAGILVGEGMVLTNNHVAGKGKSLEVTVGSNERYKAEVVKRNPDSDLALLKIPAHEHPLAVLAREAPRAGEMVFAFGHPWGQRNVLTGGVLSGVSMARTRRGEIPILKSDVHLAPGNSGGPLLNAAGEVLGLNTMVFGGDQSVAIPASVIREFLAEAEESMPDNRMQEGVL